MAVTLRLTVGPATDYLLGLAETALAGVTVNGLPAVVVDGPAFELEPGMFVVGLSEPVTDTAQSPNGTAAAVLLGGPSMQEAYEIPCCIDIRQSGATQKQVRDIAAGIFNTFLNALMADRSLGGLLSGGGAQIVAVSPTPYLIGTPAEPGQRHHLSFSVRCTDLQLG